MSAWTAYLYSLHLKRVPIKVLVCSGPLSRHAFRQLLAKMAAPLKTTLNFGPTSWCSKYHTSLGASSRGPSAWLLSSMVSINALYFASLSGFLNKRWPKAIKHFLATKLLFDKVFAGFFHRRPTSYFPSINLTVSCCLLSIPHWFVLMMFPLSQNIPKQTRRKGTRIRLWVTAIFWRKWEEIKFTIFSFSDYSNL